MELLSWLHNENILGGMRNGEKWTSLPLRKTVAGHKISGSCENFRDLPFDVYKRSLNPLCRFSREILGSVGASLILHANRVR